MAMTATLGELVKALPEATLLGDNAAAVSGIGYDSRVVARGDLFAALRGADFDGHDFVADAARRGSAAFLVESPVATHLPQIVVTDSRAALAAVSARFYHDPSQELRAVGITGTDGKTTTSYLIDHLLRTAGFATGLIGTVAVRVAGREDLHATRQTTPESSDIQRYLREMADAGTDWAMIEATSHGLVMHRLDHVRFRIGAVTNITHEHLDFHGTIETYRRAKAILLERVGAERGVVVLNRDDEGVRSVAHYAAGAEVLWYSSGGHCDGVDVWTRDVGSGSAGSHFVLATRSAESAVANFPLIGDFNVANAVCAAGVALAAGLTIEQIATGLATAPAVPGRMVRVDQGQPFSVVVDYAHTPDAMAKVLRLLRGLHPSGRLIVVFGSAGERDIEKRAVQGRIATELADIAVVTSEDPRGEDAEAIIAQIAAGAIAAGAAPGKSLHLRTDRRDAVKLALTLAQPGDCVLLAGKGHEGSIIWGREKIPWDEAGVAQELLKEAGYSRAEIK